MRPLVPLSGIASCLSSLLRKLPAFAAAAALIHASGAAAQATTVIGIANFGPHPALSRTIAGFKEEMTKQGYVDGKNAEYVYSDANFTPGLIPQTLAQVVARHPAVILTVTTPVAQASVRNVSDHSVPLVFTQVTNPVAAGLVPDWAHGSDRITGTASVTDYDAVLAFARKVFPKATSFGVLYNAGEVNDVAAIASLKTAASKAGLEMLATSVDSTVDVPQRTATMKGVGFFYAIGSNLVQSSLPAVASVTDRMKVPIISAEHEMIKKGDIVAVAYAPSYESQGAHAADLAVKMLRGTKPSALAVYRPQPGDYVAIINRAKMKALNLPIASSLDGCNCFIN
ncbi:ABC transporter substrate-binding protein [Caballeronia sp. INDeC2]|uniref:ABC transporter substrate-binding protein n=1 Tax=Caballeronia sp. INDeC2 TaxID=2921747 RepID=UPI002027BD66|nr:ABC transporter substrate-binding protein [Caballeronia sp. INDeC2]